MRLWWLNAPQWAISLIMGGFFGLFMGVFSWWQDRRLVQALVVAAFCGLFFGLIMGRYMHRQFASAREIVGEGSPEALRSAARGSMRGPVPEDPAARDAALRMAQHQLGEMRRRRTFRYVVFGCLLALEVLLALTRSTWYWLAVAFFVAMLVISLVIPRRLERRIEQLQA